MKYPILVTAFALLPLGASAQERAFTITLPEAQLNYVGKLLGKQPYEESAPAIQAIQQQVGAQMARDAQAERERLRSDLLKQQQSVAPTEEPKQ